MQVILSDAVTLIIATILLTVAAGLVVFSLLSGVRRTKDLLYAGLFAGLYGLRMFMETELVELLTGATRTLAHTRSALEYLVPVPAAILFAHYFGRRRRALNLFVFGAFVVCAAIAIPYELITGRPQALNGVVDTLVVVFMSVFFLNMIGRRDTDQSILPLQIGTGIFVLFVLNDHYDIVPVPAGESAEPFGFLIFILFIVVTLMRQTIASRGRLIAVESELTTARTIQQSLVTSAPPSIAGLDVAAAYEPASHVGGDYYEFVTLEDGRLAVFIADVSGHGVPAALVASMLKIALAAQTELTRPEGVLTSLNQLFCGRLQRQFFTAAYAILGDGRIDLASGGHPPPMLMTSQDVRELQADGFVIGRMRNARFAPASSTFAPGDVAVFYTDGIVEARNAGGEEWGWERLRQCVAAHRGQSARTIADQLLEQVRRWTAPAHADDDLTLVVVRHTAP